MSSSFQPPMTQTPASAAVSQYAVQLRSAFPNPGGSILGTAVDQIASALQHLENGQDSLGTYSKDQLGNISTNALSIKNLKRQTDFYTLPEISYFSAASYRIIPTGSWLRLVNTSGGPLTLTSLPSIATGQDGQFLEIMNIGAQSITLQDSRVLASSGIVLLSTTALVMPQFTTVPFRYSSTDTAWIQIGPPLPPVAVGVGPNSSLFLSGFTWTNNSPGAGSIAWSAGILTYKGVQYLIPAGNSGSNFWVYWQLASPTSFQSAVQGTPIGPPALGVDDFIVALNSGLTTQGHWYATTNFVASDGNRIVISGDSIFLINPSNIVVMNLGIAGSSQGKITMWNSSGTDQIELDANTGRINFPASGAPVAGKTLAGYVPVVSANGTNYFMAVYS